MDNSADCPSRDKRSLAKTDSQRIVQSHRGIGEGSKKLENGACCPKRRIFRVWLGGFLFFERRVLSGTQGEENKKQRRQTRKRPAFTYVS